MFLSFSAYARDKILLKNLGLEVFKDVPLRMEKLLGTINKESSQCAVKIHVQVTGLPAQFFLFDVSVKQKDSEA